MGLFNRFPYTDFHELNLSFILDDIEKLANRIKAIVAGLKLENGDNNKLVLKDENDDTISSVTVAYSDHSNTSDSSTIAGTAGIATRANKDVLGNDITSYIKTVETGGNSIVFKNANNEAIAYASTVVGNTFIIDTFSTAQSLDNIIENLDVGDFAEVDCDITVQEIYAAQLAGNVCLFRHFNVSSLDPDNKTLDYCQPLMDNGVACSFNLYNSGTNSNHYFSLVEPDPYPVGKLRFHRYI